MARPSGLASEHHPVGPGDAPRRKKGRKNSPSVDHLRQNVPQPQGSKRAASPTAEPSQAKRKRVQVDDHDQLARELEDSVSRAQPCLVDSIQVTAETTTTTVHKSRRHSEPLVPAQDKENDSQDTPRGASTQLLPGLTPHLNRISAPRGRSSNARRARMSMPAQIRVEPIDENNGDQEFQYAPMSAVLDNRTRRRLRRSHLSEEVNEIEGQQKDYQKLRSKNAELLREQQNKDKIIKDLEYQLEARRLGEIDMTDDDAEEMQDQLTQARNEIAELRAREPNTFDGSVDAMDDDEQLMLIDPEDLGQEDIDTEPLPIGEYAARALEMSSQVTVSSLATLSHTSYDVLADASQTASVPDKISDRAVKRYENELERLTRQLAESQGALRVIAVELQNLDIVEPGASSDVILTKLRHGFEVVREELENLLPGRTTGLTNSELLHNIPVFFQGVLSELREKVMLSEKHHQNEQVFRVQYEGVLDLLSRSHEENIELEKQINDLQETNATKQRRVTDLEESVATLNTRVHNQDADIQQKTAELNGLQDELHDKDSALARLHDCIETYRKDLDTVTKATTRLEDEHRETIADMEREHAATILDFQTQLNEESQSRKLAEEDATQKTEYIDELEAKIELIEASVGNFTVELEELSARLTAETLQRETAEQERDEQSHLAQDYANTIENFNELIADLDEQVAQFKTDIETDRAELKETEVSLDEANTEIADLNTRLHDLGVQANELRSKLFQVQQEKAQAVSDLEEEAREQQAQHEELLDVEAQRRQVAEEQVANLNTLIVQLEAKIAGLEDDIAQRTQAQIELEHDRDKLVTTLNAQLADLKQKYSALENASNSTITTLQASIIDLTNQVNAQQMEIERLTEDAAAMENALREELGTKTQEVAHLETDLEMSRATNDRLVRENKSLEDRVADEAMELLHITDLHAQERTSLLSVITTHEAAIKSLQDAASLRATEHEEAVAEKVAEVEELRVMGGVRAEYIVSLEAQVEDLKERFRAADEDNRRVMDTLLESQRQLQEQNEALASALKKRSADALKAVQEMKVEGVEVRTRGAELHKVANGRIGKVSESVRVGKKEKGKGKKVTRRQWDSGFGMDERIENGVSDVEEGVVV